MNYSYKVIFTGGTCTLTLCFCPIVPQGDCCHHPYTDHWFRLFFAEVVTRTDHPGQGYELCCLLTLLLSIRNEYCTPKCDRKD